MAFDTITGSRELTCPIVTKQPSKRIVEGPVLIPDEEDNEGDSLSKSEIEELAHKFMKDYRNIDLMHTLNNVAEPVESYITKVDRTFEMDGETVIVPKGSWFLASYVESDDAWQAVLNGELQGYSIMAVQEHVVKKLDAEDPKEDREETLKQLQMAAKNGLISQKDIRTVNLDELGDSFVVNAVSLVDEPCVPKARFMSVKSLDKRVREDFVNISAKIKDTAREPGEIQWDGTETDEDIQWGETPSSLSAVYSAWLDLQDDVANPPAEENVNTVSDTPESFREWVSDGTIVGDPEGYTWSDVRAFPVVNFNTYALHEDGLRTANQLAPTASINDSLANDIQGTAESLLEEEFDVEVDDSEKSAGGSTPTNASFKELEGTLDEELETRREAVEDAIANAMAASGEISKDDFWIWMKGLFENRAVFEFDVRGEGEQLFQIGYEYDSSSEEATLTGNAQPVDIQEVLVPVTKSHYQDMRAQVLKASAAAANRIDELETEGEQDRAAKFVRNFAEKNNIRPRGSMGFNSQRIEQSLKSDEDRVIEELEAVGAAQKEGRTISDKNLGKLATMKQMLDDIISSAVTERDEIQTAQELIEMHSQKSTSGTTQKGGDEAMDEEEVREIVQEEMEGVAEDVAEDAATKAVDETLSQLEELEEAEEASQKSEPDEGEEEEDVSSDELEERISELEDQVETAEKRATESRQPLGQDASTKSSEGDDGDEEQPGVERGPNGTSQNKVYG